MNYTAPREKPVLSNCYIYHSIDLPGETLTGDWDLRPVIGDYTGRINFNGKRVLDVGTASGMLSFHADKQGALEVVSFDGIAGCCVPVPWVENDPAAIRTVIDHHLELVKNGYWYCWHSSGSKAKVVYGDVNSIAKENVGEFDAVMAGCILLHLQNPFGALEAITRVCRSELVIAELDPGPGDRPVLLPNYCKTHTRAPSDLVSWWQFPSNVLSGFLDVLGFTTEQVCPMEIYSPSAGQFSRFYSLKAIRRK